MATSSPSTSVWMTLITTPWAPRATQSASGVTGASAGSLTMPRMTGSHFTLRKHQPPPPSGQIRNFVLTWLHQLLPRSRAGESGCATDFLSIPNASNHRQNGGFCSNNVKQCYYSELGLTISLLSPLLQSCTTILEGSAVEEWIVIQTPPPTLSFTPLMSLLLFKLISMAMKLPQTTRTGDLALTTDK